MSVKRNGAYLFKFLLTPPESFAKVKGNRV